MNYYRLVRPFLQKLPPETAHSIALFALRWRLVPPMPAIPQPSLKTSVFNLNFSSPVGLAAGFDKDAIAIQELVKTGAGFVEVGTCTPKPQKGKSKPRLFRLKEDQAVINRMGFPSKGKEVFVANLMKPRRSCIVGANIGKNSDSPDAAADYLTMLEAVMPYVDYIAVNISSPNTKGLRELQEKEALDTLILALLKKRTMLGKNVPLLVKIAPDLDEKQQADIASVALERGVDGLIISNTTIARPNYLQSEAREQEGGLSGRPLFTLSTEALRNMYRLTKGKLPLIGVGGIAGGEDAYAKIRAGASLVQLYTALSYDKDGFGLLQLIYDKLAGLLARDGFSHVSEAVGVDAR